MGTTSYFERAVKDEGEREHVEVVIECGTTGFAGKGPQLFLKFDDRSIIMPHKDAQEFCAAVAHIARYFGYPDD